MARQNPSVFSQGDPPGGYPGPSGGAGGNAGSPVPAQLRNRKLYPLDDPEQAMMNVLMDRGYNPFRTNPFIGDILGSASGLANLWMLSNLNANANDLNANGGADTMFRDFLVNQLSNGSIFNSLAGGMRNFGGYMGQIRALQDRLGDPNAQTDVTQLPPFLGMLENQLNSPRGFGDIYGSMAQPTLGGKLGQSFNRSMQGALFGGWRNFLQPENTPNVENPPNFFDFIMGRR
jgi:hypothetical protein